jgi:hypothetical protein
MKILTVYSTHPYGFVKTNNHTPQIKVFQLIKTYVIIKHVVDQLINNIIIQIR